MKQNLASEFKPVHSKVSYSVMHSTDLFCPDFYCFMLRNVAYTAYVSSMFAGKGVASIGAFNDKWKTGDSAYQQKQY